MDIIEIRDKKRKLEQDILILIRRFEDETTILVDKIKTYQATNPQDFPCNKTIYIDISTIVF